MDFHLKNIFSSINASTTSQPKKVVGIDLGSSSIKVVEIELRDDILTLNTYGELQLGPYVESELGSTVTLPLEKRIEAVIDVMRESGVTARDGVLALPLSGSFVTVITIPAQEQEDITPRVHVEARKYIPVPIADVALEWAEIQRPEGSPANEREVLLAAIQNESLKDMKAILDAIDMTSHPSEIELFSTLRSVSKESDESVGIIDVGADMSKLYIAKNGSLQRIHRVHAGGAHVTKEIAKQLSITFEEAENLKRNYAPSDMHAEAIKKAMQMHFERPLQEFKRVVNQFELKNNTALTRVVLSGGTVSFPDFRSFTQYAFDREIELTNPFAKIAYPAFMEDRLKEIAPIFAVALGAALRPFEI